MKKLNLSKINLRPEEVLEKKQMEKIHGGAGWLCYCGIHGSLPSYYGSGMYFHGSESPQTEAVFICAGSASCFSVY